MKEENTSFGCLKQFFIGLLVTIIGGIFLHHYSKNDNESKRVDTNEDLHSKEIVKQTNASTLSKQQEKKGLSQLIEIMIKENGGRVIEPKTGFSFFCTWATDSSQNADISIHFPESTESLSLEFRKQGSYHLFKHNNHQYRITLVQVIDGGGEDTPVFHLELL